MSSLSDGIMLAGHRHPEALNFGHALQLFAVTVLSFVLVTIGAFIFRLVVPDSAKKSMMHW